MMNFSIVLYKEQEQINIKNLASIETLLGGILNIDNALIIVNN